MKNLFVFSALRLATFGIIWYLLAWFMDFYLAGVAAAIIAFFISIIFFGKPRQEAVKPLQAAVEKRAANRTVKVDEDAASEDAAVEAVQTASKPASTQTIMAEDAAADDDYLMNYGKEN